jgi:hypothetical protein
VTFGNGIRPLALKPAILAGWGSPANAIIGSGVAFNADATTGLAPGVVKSP